MDISQIKDLVLDYLFDDFDHSLINQSNNPFLQITLINVSEINPHRDSFGFYVTQRGVSAIHSQYTTINMATALVLESEYLLQKPSVVQPIETPSGCTKGLVAGKDKALIVTVVANIEDARFVNRSVFNKLRIAFNH